MSVPITPKSVWRKNNNVTVGLGEVPAAVEFDVDGNEIEGWMLPTGEFTTKQELALKYAEKLDKLFTQNKATSQSISKLPEHRKFELLNPESTKKLNKLLNKHN